MHHFFLERFLHPADWFEKRLAYTRSVAASSMVSLLHHRLTSLQRVTEYHQIINFNFLFSEKQIYNIFLNATLNLVYAFNHTEQKRLGQVRNKVIWGEAIL